MDHQAPQPHCIVKIEAIGCCEKCAKKVRKKIVRLKGVNSVDMDIEKRWVYIAGDIEPLLLTKSITLGGKPAKVILIYYCSKEAVTDNTTKYHGKKQAENLPKETQYPNEYYHQEMASHDGQSQSDNCPMQNKNQDSSHPTTKGDYSNPNDHYAPSRDWVHKVENYVPPVKQHSTFVHAIDRECACEFHAWKRHGISRSSSGGGGGFGFDHRVPRSNMRSMMPPPWPFRGHHQPMMPPIHGHHQPMMPPIHGHHQPMMPPPGFIHY